jgi:hypothetical protein
MKLTSGATAMKTIQTRLHTEPDGTLTLTVPSGIPDADLDVLIVLQPAARDTSKAGADSRQWEHLIRQTAGSIQDPTFFRHEQGDYEKREGWE